MKIIEADQLLQVLSAEAAAGPTGEEMSDVVKVQRHNYNLLQPYDAGRTGIVHPEEAARAHAGRAFGVA